MLQIEAQMPGFGGFFIDSVGDVVIWMKSTAQGAPTIAAARAQIHRHYQAREQAIVKQIMSRADQAEVREADYTLAELVAIEQRVLGVSSRNPSFAGVGVSIFLNRVKVGFQRPEDVGSGLDAIVSSGVPRASVIPEVWGRTRTLSNWSTAVPRPTRGGVRLQLPGTYPQVGSHGFNVRAVNTNVDYFMTASHVATVTEGINGLTGTGVYQPTYAGGLIGQIAINRPWQDVTDPNCQGYDYCTTADVALGTFSNGVTGERKVGVSVTEGTGGARGSDAISNWYPIAGTVAVEFIQENRNIVHKSGYTTGTTTGGIDLPCAYIPTEVRMGTVLKGLLQRCVARVAFGGVGRGDSGGVVFARMFTGGPYYALGILVSGGPIGDDEDICSAGQACRFSFAQWSAIEARMGVGPLNPTT